MDDERTLEAIANQQDDDLLTLANEKGKFAIEASYDDPRMQAALQRAIDNEWITLVDVTTTMAYAPGRLMRVFRLTEKGRNRRAELDLLFAR